MNQWITIGIFFCNTLLVWIQYLDTALTRFGFTFYTIHLYHCTFIFCSRIISNLHLWIRYFLQIFSSRITTYHATYYVENIFENSILTLEIICTSNTSTIFTFSFFTGTYLAQITFLNSFTIHTSKHRHFFQVSENLQHTQPRQMEW